MTLDSLISAAELGRLTAVPRPSSDAGRESPLALQQRRLLAATVDAYVSERPVLTVWLRRAAAAPLEVYVPAPRPRKAAADGISDEAILFPPGGRAVRPVAGLADALMEFAHWVICGLRADPIAVVPGQPATMARPGFEDVISYLHDEPFAWLVAATGRPAEEIDDELRRLRLALPGLRDDASMSEASRLAAERAESRYRELTGGRATGMWDVTVAAAGADERRSRVVAALLASATDFIGQPYLIRPQRDTIDLGGIVALVAADRLATDEEDERGVPRFFAPLLVPPAVLTALARPPLDELPGIRALDPSTFDSTREPTQAGPMLEGLPRAGPNGLTIAGIVDSDLRDAGELDVSYSTLNRHTFVCGATGSGKSQTVRTLLEGLSAGGIPWLVIEPAKAEYAGAMAGRLGPGRVLVLRPGDPSLVAAGLNPLAPADGFPLQSHVDLVRTLFLAAFQADEPFPQVLARALTEAYAAAGWDLVSGAHRSGDGHAAYPSLADLQLAASRVVTAIGYSDKVASDIRGFMDVRLGSLRMGSPGRFFEGGHPLDFGRLLAGNTVLEIENVANDEDKAFLIGTVLVRLVEHLRTQSKSPATEHGPLRHVTVIEEAHRLLRNTNDGRAVSHAVETFASLLAEIRAYGEGIVVAEQIPAKLIPDVVKNTALKIVHRLPAADDRATVGATMNMTASQAEFVVSLRPGMAAMFTDGMDRPILTSLPDRGHLEVGGQPEVDPPLCGRARAACSGPCLDSPCSTGHIGQAEALRRRVPEIDRWAELVTLGHLAGHPVFPLPRLSLRQELAVDDNRTVACAIGLAVTVATAARRAWIAEFDADALAAHVGQAMMNAVSGSKSGCGSGRCRDWQSGASRYVDVEKALIDLIAKGGEESPGLPVAQVVGRGLRLPSGPAGAQLTTVRRHAAARRPQHRDLLLGGYPGRFADLAGHTAAAPLTETSLREA